MQVHHLGLAGDAAGLAALERRGVLTLDGAARDLLAGPNLYLLAGPGRARPHETRPANMPGIAHLCVQARDGDAARLSLEAAGARFLSPPVALGTGFLYAYAHDAAGRLIELESAPFLPAAPPAWFGHVAFVSPDAERLAHFYGALLAAPVAAGGRFHDNLRIDQVAGLDGVDVSVWWVRARRFTLEFWRYDSPRYGGPPADGFYTHLGVETANLAAAMAQVEAGGGVIESPPVTTGAGQGAWARDPDGNRLLLLALADPALRVRALPHADALPRAAAARPPR